VGSPGSASAGHAARRRCRGPLPAAMAPLAARRAPAPPPCSSPGAWAGAKGRAGGGARAPAAAPGEREGGWVGSSACGMFGVCTAPRRPPSRRPGPARARRRPTTSPPLLLPRARPAARSARRPARAGTRSIGGEGRECVGGRGRTVASATLTGAGPAAPSAPALRPPSRHPLDISQVDGRVEVEADVGREHRVLPLAAADTPNAQQRAQQAAQGGHGGARPRRPCDADRGAQSGVHGFQEAPIANLRPLPLHRRDQRKRGRPRRHRARQGGRVRGRLRVARGAELNREAARAALGPGRLARVLLLPVRALGAWRTRSWWVGNGVVSILLCCVRRVRPPPSPSFSHPSRCASPGRAPTPSGRRR